MHVRFTLWDVRDDTGAPMHISLPLDVILQGLADHFTNAEVGCVRTVSKPNLWNGTRPGIKMTLETIARTEEVP